MAQIIITNGAAAATPAAGTVAVYTKTADKKLYLKDDAGLESQATNATHTGDATGATALTVVAINGTNMAGLATGILKNTTTTGVPSIAIAGDFPTLNQSTTGNAATATALNSTAVASSGITMNTAKLLGRGTAAVGAIEEITLGTNLSFTGTTLNATADAPLTINGKTGAFTVNATDLGKIINCTSGTFTVSLTAAATLGAGFNCWVWNTSVTITDVITIDPSGAELIDGLATIVLQRGEGVQIISDAANWQTGDKKAMRGYAENVTATGLRPIASGQSAIAIGESSEALGVASVALGQNTQAQGYAIALGYTAVASGAPSIALGYFAAASSTYSTSIGDNSLGLGSQAVTGAGAMALGGSYASGTDSFAAAIGLNTSSYGATGANAVAVGYWAKASGPQSISFGDTTIASNTNATAIGNTCQATSADALAMGRQSLSAIIGKSAFASGMTTVVGDAQSGTHVLRATSAADTVAILTSDGAAAATTNQMVLPTTGMAIAFRGLLIGKQTVANKIAAYTLSGTAVNTAGTVTLDSGTPTIIGTHSMDATYTAPTIAVNGTRVEITSGKVSGAITHWVLVLDTAEILF